MNDFPNCYQDARTRFLDKAHRSGYMVWHYLADGQGPDGEPLACDVAVAPRAESASRALVISSGLHGVEGYFGSALQNHLFERIPKWSEQAAARIVLIHSFNPFGFAWRRRCDAENIDPNRNFVIDEREYAHGSPIYRRLERLLNPAYPPRIDFFGLKTLVAIARYGYPALKRAVAEGQYEYPRGLFYGGRKPCWTRQIIERYMAEWLADCSTIVHLDFHTGLGKWGDYRLMLDYEPADEQRQWLEEHFDVRRLQVLTAEGAYQPRGGMGGWLQHQFVERQYVYICAECGTYPALQVIGALRRENQAHHFCAAGDPRLRSAKARLVEIFCPRLKKWRARALAEGAALVERTLNRIQLLPPSRRNRVK